MTSTRLISQVADHRRGAWHHVSAGGVAVPAARDARDHSRCVVTVALLTGSNVAGMIKDAPARLKSS